MSMNVYIFFMMENIQYKMKKKKLGCNGIFLKKENDEIRMLFFN